VTHGSRWGLGIVLVAASCAPPGLLFAQLVPSGSEFRVNTYTTSTQITPVISADAAGNFVVVWSSYGQDEDQFGVFARRYESNGTAIGAEFQVNSYTTGYQYRPAVSVAPAGEFLVTWDSVGQDGSEEGVFGQRYSSAGIANGTEFQVNTQTVGHQEVSAVAVIAGGFVVAWQDYDQYDATVFARRYDSNGTPQGPAFQVNTFTPYDQQLPDVAAAAGGFLIVWDSFKQDGDADGGVFMRRYDSSGVAQGTEFLVNSYTTSSQSGSAIAAAADGSFVVVWSGYGSGDASLFGIFGQRYDSAALRVGTEFQVNTYTTGPQGRPRVAVSEAGQFVVTWQSVGEDGNGYGIFARAFKSNGAPDGSEVQVNQYTTGHQVGPSIASVGDGSFVVVWQSPSQDGDFFGVFGRRLTEAGNPITAKKLSIRTPPSATSGNTLVYVSTDPSLGSPESADQDPRCPPVGSGSLASGAKLRVVGAGGDFTIDLPCLNWSANSAGTRYRYRDATGATCTAIIVEAGHLLKAICKGPQVAYTLGAPQGDVNVVLTTGDPATNRKYCATLGPQTSARVVHDGSDGKTYKALQAGPGACP